MPMFLNPERSVDTAMTLIIKVAWGELKNLATIGADKKRIKKRTIPRIAETVHAVSRYDSTFSFFCIKAV